MTVKIQKIDEKINIYNTGSRKIKTWTPKKQRYSQKVSFILIDIGRRTTYQIHRCSSLHRLCRELCSIFIHSHNFI